VRGLGLGPLPVGFACISGEGERRFRTGKTWPINWRLRDITSTTGEKLVIESKAEMAKRDVASKDGADALALTFAASVAVESVVAEPTYWKPPPVRLSRNSWLG
jgi:hypothetical protein